MLTKTTKKKTSSILITGGSGGIGRALVKGFAKAGWEVHFTYRSDKKSADAIIKNVGPTVKAYVLDQGDPESINLFVKTLKSPIDAIIHNAALGSATVEKYAGNKHEQDEALLKVNSLGPMWLTEALLPKILRSRKTRGQGKIIFISSVGGGITHFPKFRAADGMSKAALTFYARTLASELTHEAVDVFTICPGATETEMFLASTLKKMTQTEKKKFINHLPKRRLIQPEEIANLALYLCSESSIILHGAVLDASQGLGNRPGVLTEL